MTREQAVEYAESIGRDDLMIAAFTAWNEPTSWQARRYGTVDRPIVGRLSRLLKRTDLAPDVRSRLLTAYAEELVGEDDPTVLAAARERCRHTMQKMVPATPIDTTSTASIIVAPW